jgi:hypothetical protein
MLTESQILREQPSEWLVCPTSAAKAIMVCNELTCNAYPVMCCDGERLCQESYREHLQLRARGFLDKINELSDQVKLISALPILLIINFNE